MTEWTCTEARTALGVYVLGAIEPAERSIVDAHLSECPACRDELAGLAGLPALLARVNEAQLDEPPGDLLDALLVRAAEEQRAAARVQRTRWWWAAPLAAAAMILLLVGALFGGLLGGDGREIAGPGGPTPSPTRTATPAPEELTAADPASGLSARLEVTGKRWGTEVILHMNGAPPGESCRLRVIARDGSSESIASWHVAYEYGQFRGSTMIRRDQISSFEIVTVDGRRLLTIPA
ncbi:hypothetical protein DPM19_29600 [Actinomadura craniellae]|uniref:Putative zinc-finger domain-containing protein n=1 Tax=Actinomadura craniellae TaxID=2231787 RepID=A0A365GXA5_9ACTN|nr:zf-HC2 domain-containing protein [Actinomadura craniellae]RAY11467.1 hypothetical protein DPM19_29600 [Actinomadura craniellae]